MRWILPGILLLVIGLHIVTFEAIKRSQDRAECYRQAKKVEHCPRAAVWEIILRKFLRTEPKE